MASQQVQGTFDLKILCSKPAQNYIYKVPNYQREYVWGKDQINDLINDFIDPENPLVSKPHYIGTITRCKINEIPSPNSPQYDEVFLIDGQQRFTTLMLFTHAINTLLVRLVRNHNLQNNSKYRETKKLIDKILFCDGNTTQRLVLNDLNSEYYNNYISKYYQNTVTIPEKNEKGNKNACLEIAFHTIYSAIEKYYLIQKTNSKKIEFLNSFLEKTITDLEFTIIDVNNPTDAARIFETLNFRGKQLEACEIIKNRVLRNLAGDREENTYINRWIEVSKNLKTTANLDDYIRFVYIAKNESTTNENLAWNVLNKWIKTDTKKTKEFMDILYDNYTYYLYFSDKNYSPSTPLFSTKMDEFSWLRDDYIRVNICKPFRAAIIKAKMLDASDDELYKVAYTGFNFFLRKLSIMNGKLNEFISKMNEIISKAEDIIEFQNSLSKLFVKMAPDKDFTDALKKFKFRSYSESKSGLGYTMIWRFESQNFSDALKKFSRNKVDIEHILPNKFEKNAYWKSDSKKSCISSDDVCKFGNLILLEGNLNTSVSNNHVLDKPKTTATGQNKTQYGKYYLYLHGRQRKKDPIPPTAFPIAQSIATSGINWNSKSIDARTDDIINGCNVSGFDYKGLKELFPLCNI